MIRYLREPFPLHPNYRVDILYTIGTGIFIGWFLVVFQPNGTDDWQHPYKYPFLWGYGGVISSVLLLMRFLVPGLIPKLFREANWTVAKHILYLMASFFMAMGACYLYYSWFFGDTLRWGNFVEFSIISSTIAVFPLSAFVMLSYIRLLKKYQGGAARVKVQTDLLNKRAVSASPLKLFDEFGKMQLELPGEAIYFLQSSLNYVEIYYQTEGQLKKELLRNSFQKVEEQLQEGAFIRCHRSYIVNLQKVKSVSGNAQGYKLHLDNHDLIVPVSRSKSKFVLDQIH